MWSDRSRLTRAEASRLAAFGLAVARCRRRRVELTLVDDGEGRRHGRFIVPSHVRVMLERHLLALTNAARHTDAGLCPGHHRLAHDSRCATTIHADTKVTFGRRT